MAKNRQSKIEGINALAELDRVGWDVEPDGEDEVKCRCPVHNDATPSVQLNVKKNLWNCKASHCAAKGDIVTLIAHILKVERATVLVDLGTRYDLEAVKIIDPANVEKFHEAIWSAGPFLDELRKRGVNDDMIRTSRLGFFQGRICIPIYDAQGNIVNVRRYLPGAPGPQKFKNTQGYGGARLFGIQSLLKPDCDTVWICGGELKALVAGWHLRKETIACISPSAGEGSWNHKWTKLLSGKDVYVCMDIDNAGKVAARQVGNVIHKTAKSVKIIELPLDPDEHPKGDLNDYIGPEGAGAGTAELLELMSQAREFIPQAIGPANGLVDQAVTETTLQDATQPRFTGRRIKFEAISVAMDDTPFLIPSKVQVVCDRNQSNCSLCPIFNMEQDPDTGGAEVRIPPSSIGILGMVNSPLSAQEKSLAEGIGIPPCKVVAFSVRDHYRVTDVRLSPQLQIGQGRTVNIVQPAYIIDTDLEMNAPYDMLGVMYPHPKNQQAVLIVESATEAEDNLTSYAPSADELADLAVFQPKAWSVEGIDEQIGKIYQDLEANVTAIFGRREIHLCLDLTYHSPITFRFDGRFTHGWVNTLIIGDSAQGKSETSMQLMRHYGLGEKFDCKNATVAGLLGGLQQLGSRWFVSWGVIPTHDRRLVVLEEVKGCHPEVLGKLTEMRSSGIAELGKIERRRAHARTRLVFISNPRGRRTIGSYNFGVEAVRDLIGNLEDIRRFDLAIVVSSSQIDPEFITNVSRNKPVVDHKFSTDLCRRLILWGWTRSTDQIKFTPNAIAAVYDRSLALAKRFSESLPLIDRGTVRLKLARLSVSLAIRLFSVGKDPEVALVRKCHVTWVANFLDQSYSDPVFGYAEFSSAQTKFARLADPDGVKDQIRATKFPRDFVENLLYADMIRVEDFQTWCDVELGDAQRIMSFLVRKRAIWRRGREYVKSPDFITMLREMEMETPVEAEQGKDDEF